MSEDEIRELVRNQALPYATGRIRSTGVTAWGIAHGLNGGGLCRFMAGKQRPAAELLNALELERSIVRDQSAQVGSGNESLTEDEVRQLLRQRAAPYARHQPCSTGLMAWAIAHGLHKSEVSAFMLGRRPPGSALLNELGLKWRILERQLGPSQEAIGAARPDQG